MSPMRREIENQVIVSLKRKMDRSEKVKARFIRKIRMQLEKIEKTMREYEESN